MPAWFLRGLRRGVVTTRYPARPDSFARDLATPPQFRADRLTRELAERLAAVCPSTALRRDTDVLVYDVGACTACGRCEEAAPEAVSPSGQFELAVTSRAHLIKRIPLLGEAGRSHAGETTT
jgi:dissimilatory sulfite reductase (desulfoviridin) alpha/beta subunit